jgi:NDP-sugar pyrophosphorylase family protein/mannose-6-phosphate isomerase-like protein (cupin superfamily)
MKVIYKPWGKEEWLELNDKYCYKRIYINAGYKTSYQYHHFKRETNFIISGEAEIWLENDEGVVEKKIMKAGEYFNVTPPKKHRVIAITDIILQEVSTPEVDDVIRIEDDTNRIDGKIDGEHQKPAVLILAAGYGSRLKKLTDNINKVLLPINNKAIISHIVDMFPSDYDFVVALGYKGDAVKEYLEITHSKHNFIFENIENYDPLNSGPGLSAKQCSSHLQRPFYFITADCMIDSPLPHLDGNWLGVYPTSYPEKYSTVDYDENGNVINFTNKNVEGFDSAFIGFGGVLDYKVFWSELEKNYKNNEIVSAFESPDAYPILKIKKLKWLDTGNLDDLEKTREYFKDKPLSLQKDVGEITYKDGNVFLKFIPNLTALKNKDTRAQFLKDLIPPNFSVTNNFLHYEWTNGETLYQLDDLNLFSKFVEKLNQLINTNTKTVKPNEIMNFYVNKTKDRFKMFVQKYGTDYSFLEHEINGIKRPSMESLLFDNKKFDSLIDNPFYELFHGDLQFDNIIYNEQNDKFYYIDWRDSFGKSTDSGDVYYDLAKLYGGLLIPYNKMKNEDNITYNEGSFSINYSYPISKNLSKFRIVYEKWLVDNGYDINKIKLITGLIFLNMSPLHDGKFGKMLWFKSIEMLDTYDK